DGSSKEEQGEGAVAVVHSVVLHRGGGSQLCAALGSSERGGLRCVEPYGARGADCGAVSDRHGDLAGDTATGGDSSVGAGHTAVGGGGERFAVGYPCGMDCA